MKKMNKKAFTLIELIVVVAVVGILVLLGMPRFIGYKDKAELARIQHDVKVMEQEVGTVFVSNGDEFNSWEDNSKDLNQLIQEGRLFEKEGDVKEDLPIDKTYKIIPEKYKDNINTKLKGTFYANKDGKVYYEHEKPIGAAEPEEEPGYSPEEEPGYSDEEIDDLVYNHNYIPIATADELNNVRSATSETYGKGTQWKKEYVGGLDKKYVQVANVDLSDYSKEGWSPIGTNEGYDEDYNTIGTFTGIYDGGNYVITGLEVKGESKNYQGLFGYTDGATIRNVGLIDNRVTGAKYVGGLVGKADGSRTTISNSYAKGSVTGEKYVGGLVGEAYWYTKINNSYATGEVESSEGWAGGLVGKADLYTKINNSYATGEVTSKEQAGGLVGRAEKTTISNSYAEGSVEGTTYTGGLVGAAENKTVISNSYATGAVEPPYGYSTTGGLVGAADNIIIKNSYATGSVTRSSSSAGGLVGHAHRTTISNSYAEGSVESTGNHVGGLVGYANSSPIENSYATGSVTGYQRVGGLVGTANWSDTTISNSYATGEVESSEGWAGGLVGWAYDNSTASNSYWNIETTGQEESAGGGIGKTTEEMKQQTTYPDGDSGWDFTNIWEITPGNYPTLK